MFRATPPVLRGLYEFEFGPQGLSVMHCRPVDIIDEMEAVEQGLNMSDFARTNRLPPPPVAGDIQSGIAELKALETFAAQFYNSHAVSRRRQQPLSRTTHESASPTRKPARCWSSG